MESLQAFAPIARHDARIVVLGSMPGIASLDAVQYYAHPRNAFWKIINAVFECDESDYDQRVRLLIDNRIAVWDVLQECKREGSLDSNIQNDSIVCNDFRQFFVDHTSIDRVLFNGKTSEKLFKRHAVKHLDPADHTGMNYVSLPSTSPAMASLSVEDKIKIWSEWLVI